MPKRLASTGPTLGSNLANKTQVGILDGKRVSLKVWALMMESSDEEDDEPTPSVDTSSTAPTTTPVAMASSDASSPASSDAPPAPATKVAADVGSLPLHQRPKSKGGTRVNLHTGTGIGDVVSTDEHGVWRTVPGFHPDHINASTSGLTRSRAPGGGWEKPTPGCCGKDFYFYKKVNGYRYPVIQLVLRAFVGPGLPGQTGDHIAKYDGDKKRERGDNRAVNVRWATPALQSTNRGVRKAQRSGQPILVRDPAWPDGRWDPYPSATAAEKALGVKNLGNVANGERSSAGERKYIAKWAPPDETQDDLPAATIRNNKGELIHQPAEVWRQAVYSDGKPMPGWRASNRSRAQKRYSSGTGWGYKFTPMPRYGEAYAKIGGSKLFHVSVFFTFGGKLREGETVDHVDRDPTNNTLANLKAESRSGQVLNQTRKPISERGNSKKKAIEARPRDDPNAPWRWFESQIAAARVLGVGNQHISQHLKGNPKYSHVGGFIFRRAA